jgi:hypothetical protein
MTTDKADETIPLCALPDEVLLDILQRAAARDAEALGASCSRMRPVARDSRLWAHFFRRDHGRCYRPHTRSRDRAPWPYDPADPKDPWPAVAVPRGVARDEILARLPPPDVDVDPAMPEPFAHARAMGKCHRWLYIAHVRRIRRWDKERAFSSSIAASGGPVTIDVSHEDSPLHHLCVGWGGLVVYRGGVFANPDTGTLVPRGYGAVLLLDDYDVAEAWYEAFFDPTLPGGVAWSVRVASGCMTVMSAPHGAPDARYVVTSRCEIGTERRFAAPGPIRTTRTALYPDGSYSRAKWYVTSVTRTLMVTPRGVEIEVLLPDGRLLFHLNIQYPNGDSATAEPTPRFSISARCPDTAFAGRTIVAATWRMGNIRIHPDVAEHFMWTTGDGDDDRLFRAYARSGLAGWGPAVQAAILAAIEGLA